MWKNCILVLCAAGIASAVVEPQSFSVNPPPRHRGRNGRGNEGIRRFACPVGFFRLRRNCYYLSAGTAPWREAHFHCKDRNATLAVLDKGGKDRILRKYLMGDQFTKLERWIGGIFNWQQMAWEWGVSGEKIVFQSFSKLNPGNSKQYAWHCIIMDPALKYKWSPRSCVEPKHYICEVPAGRIAKRRKKLVDEPQNQRMKPRKTGKKYNPNNNQKIRQHRRNKQQQAWRREWMRQSANEGWSHGVNLGSRPPSNVRLAPGARPSDRMRHANKYLQSTVPRVSQIIPQGREYGAYLGDGPANHKQSQSLADRNNELSQFHAKINDLSLEEVLLKT
ncbi:uncharacterized protein LOC105704065 [Orussus abietinus]|uniref:uncharacterized protein LOC105704065 n=1 Tax=Orussus abietinus TaxID=222816 RepID=UPI000625EC15|nr:uncharacterized protein LOC105704065 [Orussus abietinus]